MVAKTLKLLVIIGPTASGKSNLAMQIAKMFNGEIVCADSRTIYKDLDIGTAKPTLDDQKQIAHWGLDLVNPDENYTASDFKKYALSIIKDIQKRGRLPIIVGGSGLYIDSLLYDYGFIAPNLNLRSELEGKTTEELQKIINDNKLSLPENYKNKRYLINTIERGKNISTRKKNIPKGWEVIGLCPKADVLFKNMENRTLEMLNNKVIDEYKFAISKYSVSAKGLNGGIYKILTYQDLKNIDNTELLNLNIKSDKTLAKKQLTWFRRNKDIKWFENSSDALKWVEQRALG